LGGKLIDARTKYALWVFVRLLSPFFLFIAACLFKIVVTTLHHDGESARWPLLLARFFLRQGLSPDGRDTGSGSEASKDRPAVFAEDASWKGRKGEINLRAVFRAGLFRRLPVVVVVLEVAALRTLVAVIA
jgi:hypothetical protein